MARPLPNATAAQVAAARQGLQLLRDARDAFRTAGAPAALAKVNAAIASADGAVRHVERRAGPVQLATLASRSNP